MASMTAAISAEQLSATLDRQMADYIQASQSSVLAYKKAKEFRDALPWWRMIARARFAALQDRAQRMAMDYATTAGKLDALRTKLRSCVAEAPAITNEGKDHVQ